MRRAILPVLFLLSGFFNPLSAQKSVADQTFRVDGTHEFAYALAEGDHLDLKVQLIAGRRIKAVELIELPDNILFRAYEVDTNVVSAIAIPRTGVYVLRIIEQGFGKKICRFALQRTPASAATARLDTRVNWDWHAQPQYWVRRKAVPAGKRTDMVSISGQATVRGSKLGLGQSRNSYQFTLPPNTTQWAYRIAVGQAANEARRQDADKFQGLVRNGATKIMAYQPETALAAFALGMAVDLTTSTGGESVEYAIVDGANLQKFMAGQALYDAHIWQGGISVDAQRRFSPLSGTWFFALKNNNWVDDINVIIDIEAVTETPLFEEEIYLEGQ